MMSKQYVIVSVADDHLSDFEQVIQRCQAVGLVVAQRLPILGILEGVIDESALPQLAAVDGIKAVEAQSEFQLKPPEDDIQ
jgi:hypothetical protein